MQNGHRTSISSASLTVDEVARRNFPIVRKGFDPTDVRMFLDSVAEQLQVLYDREDDLRRRLARAEQQAAHPEMDEGTLTAALGQETTRVLRSAHDAAGDMKARAEEGASQVIHLAHEEAARIRAEGERAAADRASEAEVTAARIRSGAASEADSVIEAARQEAQAMLAGTQEECRAMVREAQEVRARVLADLVRRRRSLYGQVEHLRGGRQNLVEALREARRSFDHILETLQRDFDPGVVVHTPPDDGPGEGEAEGPRPTEGTPRGRHAPAAVAGQPTAASAADSPDPGRPGPPPTTGMSRRSHASPAASPAVTPEPSPGHGEGRDRSSAPSEQLITPVATDAPPASRAEETAAADHEPHDRRRSGFRIIRRPRQSPAEEARRPPTSAEDPVADGPTDDEGVRVIASVDTGSTPPETVSSPPERSGDASQSVSDKEQRRQPSPSRPGRGRGGGRHRAPGSSAVDELFARIKSGRAPSAGRTGQHRAEPDRPVEVPGGDAPHEATAGPGDSPEATAGPADSPEATAAPGGSPEGSASPGGSPEGSASPGGSPEGSAAPADQGERDTTSGDEAPTEEPQTAAEAKEEEPEPGPDVSYLRRRDDAIGPITVALSRKLKRALQDDQNDLLDRLRSRGRRELVEILPPVAQHQEHFRRAGVELLDRAERAGISFLREGRESEGRTNGSASGDGGAVVLAGELASAITDPLRRRLERSLGDAADPDDASLIEYVGAAYREWKGPRIERVAGDHVVAAFSCGELGVAREGTSLRWIVDDGDERCPDCDDNALAGPLPRGERYPTGQAHPPAHSGCRCLLAPPPA